MLVYLMRHADAEPGAPGQADGQRHLTEKGLRRTQDTVKVLRRLGVELDLILSSPLVRARETAEIIGAGLDARVVEDRGVGPGCSLDTLAEAIEAHHVVGPVMFVGHEPDFSQLVGELIGRGRVEMRKGAIACVSVQGLARGAGMLVWLMAGKELSQLA
jgi:phosphohistidine phosphatase